MTPAELSLVHRMSQQERLAHFGILCGEEKITWKEFSYIVKEIPYEPNRSSENLVVDEEGIPSCLDTRELSERNRELQLRENLETTSKAGCEESRASTKESRDITALEQSDSVSLPKYSNETSDGQGGKESDLEEKLGRIRENILSG